LRNPAPIDAPALYWSRGDRSNSASRSRVTAAAATGELQSKVFGVRLRTPHITSRFGIPLNTPEEFRALIDSVGLLPRASTFGVHFHMASSNIGVRQWWHL